MLSLLFPPVNYDANYAYYEIEPIVLMLMTAAELLMVYLGQVLPEDKMNLVVYHLIKEIYLIKSFYIRSDTVDEIEGNFSTSLQ